MCTEGGKPVFQVIIKNTCCLKKNTVKVKLKINELPIGVSKFYYCLLGLSLLDDHAGRLGL